MTKPVDLVVTNAGELLTLAGGPGPAIGAELGELGIIESGALIVTDGHVEWVGPERELAAALAGRKPAEEIDAAGLVVMPAFVDPHTHIPFAAGRQAEFEMRIKGKSYLEIAEAGGGILNSVRRFRSLSVDELTALNRPRLEAMVDAGTVTIECKTGYALSVESELDALRVIAELDASGPWRLIPTFLGAHTIPDEFRDDRDGYVELILETMLPAVAHQGIARYCDVFIEQSAFTLEEGRKILTRGLELGLIPKLHVEEFTALGGSELAAELSAVSADHLEAITEEGIRALAETGTMGVLMPGVNYFLGHPGAPARRLVEAGVPIALATDFNPGSCMCHSMEMILSLACTQLRLTPAEAITAATRNAAFACGEGERRGRLTPGLEADLLVLTVADHREIAYHFGTHHVRDVVAGGRVVRRAIAG